MSKVLFKKIIQVVHPFFLTDDILNSSLNIYVFSLTFAQNKLNQNFPQWKYVWKIW